MDESAFFNYYSAGMHPKKGYDVMQDHPDEAFLYILLNP